MKIDKGLAARFYFLLLHAMLVEAHVAIGTWAFWHPGRYLIDCHLAHRRCPPAVPDLATSSFPALFKPHDHRPVGVGH